MYFPLPGFPEENVNTVQHILKVVDYIYTIYYCSKYFHLRTGSNSGKGYSEILEGKATCQVTKGV
jgi:hypothetical protein